MSFLYLKSTGPTCSIISLCLFLVSVIVSFPFAILCNDILSLEDITNKETSANIREMVTTAAKALFVKIWDGKKSTAEHMSSAGGRFFWDNISDADHAAGLFKMVVNDPSERSFGENIGQLQSYGKIGLTNSGYVSQVKVNINFSRAFDTGLQKNTKGVELILHKLSEEMRVSLVKMCI